MNSMRRLAGIEMAGAMVTGVLEAFGLDDSQLAKAQPAWADAAAGRKVEKK